MEQNKNEVLDCLGYKVFTVSKGKRNKLLEAFGLDYSEKKETDVFIIRTE